MRVGEPVFYVSDPALYGEMEIRSVRKDGRLVARVDPDGDGPAVYEIFEAHELEVWSRLPQAA